MTDPDPLPGDRAPLDAVDRALLRELLADPRLPVIELAKRVGVVRATAASRIDRLARRGVIGPGGIARDVTALGYPLTAYVGLQIRQGHGPEVRTWLETFPEVLEVHTTAGTVDVMCRIAAKSSPEMQSTIDRILSDPAIVRSTTSIVLSTPMPYRVMPLLTDGPASPARETNRKDRA
jgi:DNA-binding Lrp family transcriptional regulator